MLESGLNRVVQAGRMERNQIRIGLVSSIFWAGFGEVIRQCHQRHPECDITFTELSPERQKQALASKEIDIGLARFADTLNIHPLQAETVYRESMVLVVSDEHPLRDRKRVSLPELAAEPFVLMNRANSASTDLIINACLVEGFYPRLRQEVVEPNTLMAVVATSQQVALVPASYARQKWPHVRFIRLEQGIPADLCVLYAPPLAGQPATTAIRHFIDTMSEQMNLPERG
ncbi:HTH-type transcriptional regulator CynR [compost metagenome]